MNESEYNYLDLEPNLWVVGRTVSIIAKSTQNQIDSLLDQFTTFSDLANRISQIRLKVSFLLQKKTQENFVETVCVCV